MFKISPNVSGPEMSPRIGPTGPTGPTGNRNPLGFEYELNINWKKVYSFSVSYEWYLESHIWEWFRVNKMCKTFEATRENEIEIELGPLVVTLGFNEELPDDLEE